jgi:hypothetical protein
MKGHQKVGDGTIRRRAIFHQMQSTNLIAKWSLRDIIIHAFILGLLLGKTIHGAFSCL